MRWFLQLLTLFQNISDVSGVGGGRTGAVMLAPCELMSGSGFTIPTSSAREPRTKHREPLEWASAAGVYACPVPRWRPGGHQQNNSEPDSSWKWFFQHREHHPSERR